MPTIGLTQLIESAKMTRFHEYLCTAVKCGDEVILDFTDIRELPPGDVTAIMTSCLDLKDTGCRIVFTNMTQSLRGQFLLSSVDYGMDNVVL